MLLVLVPLKNGPSYLFHLPDQSAYKTVLDRIIVSSIHLAQFNHVTSFRVDESMFYIVILTDYI